jgi:uncharacterized protein (TIGR03437 family)
VSIEFLNFLKSEWKTLSGAPFTAILLIVFTGVLVWKTQNSLHQERFELVSAGLAVAQERIKLRDDEILFLKLQSETAGLRAVPPSQPEHANGRASSAHSVPSKLPLQPPNGQSVGLPADDPCYRTSMIQAQGQRPIAPCLLSLQTAGRRYPAVIASDGTIIAPKSLGFAKSRPAKPGEFLSAFAVGLGPELEGKEPKNRVKVQVGGRPAMVSAAVFYAPAQGQIIFEIPADMVEGEVSFGIEVAGVPSQLGLRIPVSF